MNFIKYSMHVFVFFEKKFTEKPNMALAFSSRAHLIRWGRLRTCRWIRVKGGALMRARTVRLTRSVTVRSYSPLSGTARANAKQC